MTNIYKFNHETPFCSLMYNV